MQKNRPLIVLLALGFIASCAVGSGPDLSGMSFSDEPLLGKPVWHDLITEDFDAAKSFYRGVFGWRLEESKAADGRDYVLARVGDTYVGGILSVAPRSNGQKISRWLPYISVADVDATVARAEAAGGNAVVRARDIAFGRVAAIQDREGAVVGLVRSSVGDPADSAEGPAIGTVVWNELLSNDSAAAAAFYEQVFAYGATETERRGGTYTLLSAAGRDRAGILSNPMPEWQPEWLTYFGVADPAAAAARAERLGGRIVLPVSPELREGSMAVVTDPSGAVLVLQRVAR